MYSMAVSSNFDFFVFGGSIAYAGTSTCGFEANRGQPEKGTSAMNHALNGTLQRRLLPSSAQSFPLMSTAV